MTSFYHTDETAACRFINSGADRETSEGIMIAIAKFATDEADAEWIWENGIGHFDPVTREHFVNTVTGDGQWGPASEFAWGAAEYDWLPTD